MGVIGAFAGRNVQRLPSNVYWNGLGVWGIRLYPGSEAAYYQSLDGFYERQRTSGGGSDDEPGAEIDPPNWDPALPEAPEGLLEEETFQLTDEEADYLADRLRRRAPDSLLRELIDCHTVVEEDITFPWLHPAASDLPAALNRLLEHARCFSEMIHGAALLYNLLLAEQAKWDELVADYRGRLAEWWEELVARSAAFEEWDRKAFWQLVADANGRIAPPTRSFVDAWCDCVERANSLQALIDDGGVRQLIGSRERRLKRSRARIDNRRMLETWSGASGTARLDYRWKRPVADYLNDMAGTAVGASIHA